jgi:hypothetical protein
VGACEFVCERRRVCLYVRRAFLHGCAQKRTNKMAKKNTQASGFDSNALASNANALASIDAHALACI